MMRHLATQSTEDGLTLIYTHPSLEGGDTLDTDWSRTVIGATLPDPEYQHRQTGYGYACVLAERVYPPRREGSKMPPERVYVVLDETESSTSQALFSALVALKDRYRASTVFCPNKPISLLQALKAHEGLSYYHKDRHREDLREMFDTFISKEVTAAVRDYDAPSKERAHQGIERFLSATAKDPDTGQPILGSDRDPIPRLYLSQDFNNAAARQEIVQESNDQVSIALYLALMGMERSRAVTSRPRLDEQQLGKVNPYTGY